MSEHACRRTWLSAVQVGCFIAGPLALNSSAFAQSAGRSENDGARIDDLEELVVTAQRVESRVSKTPVAVTAVSGHTLEALGITNPTHLPAVVPNLSIDRQNGLQITIRGVTSTDNTEKGDPSAAFLLDGVYVARPQAQEVSFFDVERVEVLRGPQGTLYGRNTTAGLINMLSRRPKKDFGTSFNITVGNYGTMQVTGVVNAPVNDRLSLRAAANLDRRSAFVRNTGPFDFDQGKDVRSGRLSGLFEFSDLMNLWLSVDYSDIGGTQKIGVLASNFFQTPFVAPPANGAGRDPVYIGDSLSSSELRTQRYPDVTQQDIRQISRGIAVEYNWTFAEDWTLTYLGSWRDFLRHDFLAGFGGINQVAGVQFTYPQTFFADYHQSSHELRLVHLEGPWQAQGGLYFFREYSDIAALSFARVTQIPGIRGYVFGFPQRTQSKTQGIFAQAAYSVLEDLRLTAGARYTTDDKKRIGATINHVNADDPLDFTTGPNAIVNPLGRSDSLNFAEIDYGRVTWRAGVEYDINPSTMMYLTGSTGYKAGGFNDGCEAGSDPNCLAPISRQRLYYNPETLTAEELGIKYVTSTVQVNANAFHYDYKNLQLSQVLNICSGPCQVTTNAARAKVNGFEVEAAMMPVSFYRLDLGATWLDAEYADYMIAPGVSFEGRQLDRSPEYTLSIGNTVSTTLRIGGELSAALFFRQSASYKLLSAGLRAQFTQPSHHKTDISVTYTSEQQSWYVQAFVKNIEDEITIQNATSSGTAQPGANGNNDGVVAFSDPRTFGVRVGVNLQ